MNTNRINRLISQFDGLIKYFPMLMDHPEWSDEQCIEFAKKHHEKALEQRKVNLEGWNNGIPYCRNIWREDKI